MEMKEGVRLFLMHVAALREKIAIAPLPSPAPAAESSAIVPPPHLRFG